MKILFTADLHSLESAFTRFAELLKDYDVGVIAGDIQTNELSEKEIATILNIDVKSFGRNYSNFHEAYKAKEKRNKEALDIQAIKLQNILNTAGKPMLVIKGNHDLCAWESNDNIYNINQTAIKFGDYNFVGYQYTNFERSEVMREADLYSLEPLIEKNTILVTHAPPYRVLDTITVHIFGYGPTKEPLGCEAIKHFVDRTRPRLHLFGHIHEAFGRRSNSINGSYQIPKKFWDIDIGPEYIRTKEI